MNLKAPERDVLSLAEEVRIETRSAGDDVHRTIIWAVVDGEDVFLRSVNGDAARWYREAIAGREAALLVAAQRIPIRVASADDPVAIERCSAALTAKYAADPALKSMLRPHALPTTLRVLASD